MDMKDLFRKVSSKTPTRILAEQFASGLNFIKNLYFLFSLFIFI